MTRLMEKIDKYLVEQDSNIKVIKIKEYGDPHNFDTLYTSTDGNGNYPLTNDNAVFMSEKKNAKELKELDGKPKSKDRELYVMEVDGKLGIYDSNLKAMKTFRKMSDLESFVEDNIDDLNFEHFSL